jgi:outer membrane protein OmpA-like peptidoglycan-associated protein
LRTEDKEVLSRIAGILSTLKGYQIYVYGYTDDIGTREYNQKLSERRAQSVYDYLVKSGLDPNIMTTRGFGEADPLVPGDSAKARAINRRVEIGLVDSTIKPITSLNQ